MIGEVREASRARGDELHLDRRGGDREQHAGREDGRDAPAAAGRGRGSRSRRARRRAAGAGRRNGMRPFSTLSPSAASSAGRTVSEPRTAMATTIIVPIAKPHERLVAGEEHAGHRGHDGEAGDEHRAAGGGGCGLEGGLRATCRRAVPHARASRRTASSRRRRRGRSAGSRRRCCCRPGTTGSAAPIRPIVANTEVRPSSSGMPAATSAPKAKSRISSVTGRESSPAFCEVLAEDVVDLLVDRRVADLAHRQAGCACCERRAWSRAARPRACRPWPDRWCGA